MPNQNSSSRRTFLKTIAAGAAASMLPSLKCAPMQRPNILFAIADDWSWPHASITGEPEIQTPSFDRVAHEGVLFNNCYCSAPSCTPSRGAILTGQYHWRLEQGGNLWSVLPKEYHVYPDVLEDHGYTVGYTGKGWGPGSIEDASRERNPAGPAFNEQKTDTPEGMVNIDYAANFKSFLEQRPKEHPFCFWFGCFEPHRVYKNGIGIEQGKNPENVRVPACFPDSDVVRSDILDYFVEVEHFDKHSGQMLKMLEEQGELENTLVVVTSDNGMPFPRCKANLYDKGTRMPLAIRWDDQIKAGQTVETFVSQTDFAPTFLQAAGVSPLDDMTGASLMPLLRYGKSTDTERDAVFTGRERHAWVREGGLGYPCRSIRTLKYLYIRNFKPERWPAGDPDNWQDNDPAVPYGDVDASPTKTFIMDHPSQKVNVPEKMTFFVDTPPTYHELAFGKRPSEELYDLENDPDQLINVAESPDFQTVKQELSDRLEDNLKTTNDPRILGQGKLFDQYKYYGPVDK